MGMFDDLTCEYPLPDHYTKKDYQTKSLDCVLLNYIITKEGRLVYVFGKWFDKNTGELSPYNDMSVIETMGLDENFFDSIEWKETQRFDTEYHGDIEFHGHGRSYLARFTEGQLQWLRGGVYET